MKRIWIVWLAVVVLIPTLALGQAQTTGRISGRVVDEQGEPVASARVTLVSSALQGERVMTTGDNGEFLAALLPIGPYAVNVASPGKQTVQVSLRLTVGQTVPLEIVLREGEEVVEKVTVLAAATPLETTVLGENFNYETTVEELPIASRSVNHVALYSPNVQASGWVPDVLVGVSSAAAISGAASYETVAQLDGADITEPGYGGGVSLYLEDAVEEIQVMTTGISARYGRFQGGVINIKTKSGANEFNGAVRFVFSKEAWNSKTPFGEEQSDDLNQAYQATVGGFVLKDNFWFFAGGRVVPTQTFSGTTLVTQESYSAETDDRRFQLKLRGAPSPNHIIEASYLDRQFESTGSEGFIIGDSLAADSNIIEEPMSLFNLNYQGVLGPKSFLNVVVSRKKHRTVCCGNGAPRTAFGDGSTGAWLNNAGGGENPWTRDNETASASFTRIFSGSSPGSHTFEAGVQYYRETSFFGDTLSPTGYRLDAGRTGDTPFAVQGPTVGEVRYNLNNVLDGGDRAFFRTETLSFVDDTSFWSNFSLYAQDSWKFGRWRIDAGLRWDNFELSAQRADANGSYDELSPRIGVTRDFSRNWQIQATWGRYARLPAGDLMWFLNTQSGKTEVTRLYTGPAVLDLTNDEVEAILRDDSQWETLLNVWDKDQPTNFLASDLEVPVADEFTLGVRTALPRSTGSVTLTFVDRDYRRQVDDFVGDFGANTIIDPDTGDSLIYDNYVWADTAIADRRYRAIVATWDYRPSARWDIGGNWTYSELTGNWEGNNPNNSFFEGTIIGNYERSRPEYAAVPQGNLYDDTPIRFRVWGNYRFDLKRGGQLVLGGVGRYQSGSNWSRTAFVPLADDPDYSNEFGQDYEHFFDGRGNNSFNDWWALDLSARWQIQFFKKLDGWIKVTVINVTNNDALLWYDTSGSVSDDLVGTWEPSSTFGSIWGQSNYQTPRSYVITLGLAF